MATPATTTPKYPSGFRFNSSTNGRRALIEDLAALVTELDDPANDPDELRPAAEAVYEFVVEVVRDPMSPAADRWAEYENEPFTVIFHDRCTDDDLNEKVNKLVCSDFFHTRFESFEASMSFVRDCDAWIKDQEIYEPPEEVGEVVGDWPMGDDEMEALIAAVSMAKWEDDDWDFSYVETDKA